MLATSIDLKVLNPSLYKRIWLAFAGQVKVCNYGQEMILDYNFQENGSIETVISFWGESYQVNCFGCKDKRYRLYISHKFGETDPLTGKKLLNLVKCFNEDCQKNPGFIYELCSKLFSISLSDTVLALDSTNGRLGQPGEEAEKVHLQRQPVTVPFSVITINEKIINYLQSYYPEMFIYLQRGGQDPLSVATEFGLGFIINCPPRYSYLSHGLFIPIIKENTLKAWQVRTFYPRKHYWSSPGIKNFLYYHPKAFNYSTIFLCEGPSDVWAIGRDGICLFGKTISFRQLSELNKFEKAKNIIVLLDGDAIGMAEQTAHIIARHYHQKFRVGIGVLPPDKDPADFTRKELKEWLKQQGNLVWVN